MFRTNPVVHTPLCAPCSSFRRVRALGFSGFVCSRVGMIARCRPLAPRQLVRNAHIDFAPEIPRPTVEAPQRPFPTRRPFFRIAVPPAIFVRVRCNTRVLRRPRHCRAQPRAFADHTAPQLRHFTLATALHHTSYYPAASAIFVRARRDTRDSLRSVTPATYVCDGQDHVDRSAARFVRPVAQTGRFPR